MSRIAAHPDAVESVRTSACPFAAFARRSAGAPARWGALAYGAFAYLGFLVTITYAIGFVGNWIVPKSIDSGGTAGAASALLVNAALLSIFVLQHTIMARPAFKRWWTRIIPASIERSTFVIAANASLLVVFAFWQPVPTTVWEVEQPVFAAALIGLSLVGWGLVFLSSFIISHFDLFGLRQVWARFRNRAWTPVGFRLRGPYRLVRHPLMLGFLIAFWATPHMTIGHLFFALLTTGYIFLGLWFEERDLVAEHGEAYLDYRRRVRGLLPWPKRGADATP